jgi:hypothetical protein
MRRLALLTAIFAGGCNLVDSNGLHIGYSFDVQHFTENVGDDKNPQTVPNVPCQSGATPDACAQAASLLPPTALANTTVSCQMNACAATASFTLPQKIDLSHAQTPLPSEAVQFGINAVAIDRIAYWASNKLNVDTPLVEIYVAPDPTTDIANAVKLGTIAPMAAMSSTCKDPVDAKGDPNAGSMTVCDMPLTDAGKAKLQSYVQNYDKQPFDILVHATLNANGGAPLPAGALDVYVRPSVTLSILK